jgi:hypothetical protein
MSDERLPPVIDTSLNIRECADVGSINATLRVNLAVQHMLAAARFSRDVGRVEAEHATEQFGPFWESLFHPAMACILMAAASLEAYANELFSDRKIIFSAYPPELMQNLWDTYEQKPILDKFDFALQAGNGPRRRTLPKCQNANHTAKCPYSLQTRMDERGR